MELASHDEQISPVQADALPMSFLLDATLAAAGALNALVLVNDGAGGSDAPHDAHGTCLKSHKVWELKHRDPQGTTKQR
eukprot:2032495-Lingulodinium_polyedra.AAC.1